MGNSTGKEQHGPAGTTVDQTPPISPTSPVNSHPLSSPTCSDPSSDQTPPCPSQNRPGNENGTVNMSPKKDAPVSFFKRRQSSASTLPVAEDPPASGRDCEGGVEAGLVQECMASLGLGTTDKRTHTVTDLLRRFLNERAQMKEELRVLKEKIESERNDWLQFQTDLQVALVVADRLRAEAEEELGTLREARQDLEKQLAEEKQVQGEDGQRNCLKTELKDSSQRPSQGKETQTQQGATEECPRNTTERQGDEKETGRRQNGEKETGTAKKPSDTINGVVNGTSQNTIAQPSNSVSKNNNPPCERLLSDYQDNLINSCKDKKEDKPSFISSGSHRMDPPNKSNRKPQEDLSKLIRRHGGSKRNSMLQWCQNRTKGYQVHSPLIQIDENIEITNFSSSWVDGLAFCAVYHSYLPSHVPFNTLRPENKRENLLLAFQTGQGVGITATLTAEEMLKSEGPDWQRVLGYMESIYQHFEM